MDDSNRFLIFTLLIGLVYALYTYQQKYNIQLEEEKQPMGKKSKKNRKKKKKNLDKIVEEPDIISQFSLGSLNDIELDDSIMNTESLGSESLNFMDDRTTASSVFQE